MKTITERLAIYTATIPLTPRRKTMLSITIELEGPAWDTTDWELDRFSYGTVATLPIG